MPFVCCRRKTDDVTETCSYCTDLRSPYQAAGLAGLRPRRYGESTRALRGSIERTRSGAGLRGDNRRSRGHADVRGIRLSETSAVAAQAAVRLHSRQSRFTRTDAGGVPARLLRLRGGTAESEGRSRRARSG